MRRRGFHIESLWQKSDPWFNSFNSIGGCVHHWLCGGSLCVVVGTLRRTHHKLPFSIKHAVYDKKGIGDDGSAPSRIIIQRRRTGDVDFTRTWKEYRDGFGDLDGDFWFGNDNIHKLTQKGYTRLHIELTTFDNITYNIEYGDFRVRSEAEHYQLLWPISSQVTLP
ncbi:angiopoietin-4-like [Haliotis rubra]|uniref:angiopoietin-4-like n=1 Tax=Haliotis rubra TaxID=36100 RepID=UPI001EE55A38|nr:angiopoietin-4-like [Haliotis rubra]